MTRFIRCKVKKWSKQKKKHIFKNETVWKYPFARQPSEMYLIYVVLDIGTLYFGENSRDCKDFNASSTHSLILHRSDVLKLNKALTEMRSQKYEPYFMMIEAIRDFICKYKKQDVFIFVSEQY